MILIDIMPGKSSNGFSKLYRKNYETWTETNVFKKQVADTIEQKEFTPEENDTYKYIEGYDAKAPIQVFSKFLRVRRNMISKIQDYKLKDVKVKENEATVTVTLRSVNVHGAEAAVRTLLMSLYGINIDKLKHWNQSDKSNDEKGKIKDLTTKFLYGENFNGDLTQFKDIDKEMSYTPLTGADDLEKTFKLTKDDGGNWTISVEDYKELAEALVDHDESGSRAVYAERIHKNLSDYQPEDSSDSSSKSSDKDKQCFIGFDVKHVRKAVLDEKSCHMSGSFFLSCYSSSHPL